MRIGKRRKVKSISRKNLKRLAIILNKARSSFSKILGWDYSSDYSDDYKNINFRDDI